MNEDSHHRPPSRSEFASTHWSVVLRAGNPSSPDAQRALAALCETYWYPLYAFARRKGRQPQDAEDLTQAFLSRVLEKEFLRTADPQRGRFRSLLLTMFKRFMASEFEKQQTQKRGGSVQTLSLDFRAGERRYLNEPSQHWTAERIYERQWALAVLDQTMSRLKESYVQRGDGELFEQCQLHLIGAPDTAPYSESAKRLKMSAGAYRVAVHRARERFREMLCAEVAQTLDGDDDVNQELQRLLAALRGDQKN